MNLVLLYFAKKYNGNWDEIYKALVNKEQINPHELYEIEKQICCNYTTIISADYPQDFKKIEKPPFVLFYRGNLKLLHKENEKILMFTQKNNDLNDEAVKLLFDEINKTDYLPLFIDDFGGRLKENATDFVVISNKSVITNKDYNINNKNALVVSEVYNGISNNNLHLRIPAFIVNKAISIDQRLNDTNIIYEEIKKYRNEIEFNYISKETLEDKKLLTKNVDNFLIHSKFAKENNKDKKDKDSGRSR